MWIKSEFGGHLIQPQPPLFVVSKAQNCLTRPLDLRTSGHLVQPENSPASVQLGPTVGPPGSPGPKKSLPRPLGMLEYVSFSLYEPVVARFLAMENPKMP